MSSAGSHSRPGFDSAPEAARPSFAPPDFARPAPPRSLIPLFAIIFAAQIALIALLGWNNRWQISEDGVAYLRIASYYAGWQTHLMVNGYWGPMLSWLMAPLVGIVPHPLYAARLVMGLSAVVFLLGSISLFRRLELPPAAVAVGALCAAVIGASLSAISITPDLLVAGLICLGASFLLSRSWLNRRATSWAAGIVFGLAYLAKAVALPVFCALLVALVCCELLYQRGKRRAVIGRAVVTMFAFVITAGPWIGLISQKYSRPVFSTTAAIAHAYMGPGDRPRGHPFTTSFLRPEPGRITVWEDPSELPYPSWSPLASRDNLVHQLEIIRDNSYAILNLVSRWDWLRLGPLLLLIGFLVHAPWSVNFRDQRWRLAALGVFAVCVVYLPIYASVPRYYYVTIPFLLTVALGVVTQLTAKDDFGPNPGRVIALSVIALSFSAPVVRDAAVLLRSGPAVPPWMQLAELMKERGVHGTIAGGAKEAMLIAYLNDLPHLGNVWEADPRDFMAAGANLIVVKRRSEADEKLHGAKGFEDLDALLFGKDGPTDSFPLRLYRRGTPMRTATGGTER